jgi:hypothetical protein
VQQNVTLQCVAASERLRIQVDASMQENMLSFRLAAMQDKGAAGVMVRAG